MASQYIDPALLITVAAAKDADSLRPLLKKATQRASEARWRHWRAWCRKWILIGLVVFLFLLISVSVYFMLFEVMGDSGGIFAVVGFAIFFFLLWLFESNPKLREFQRGLEADEQFAKEELMLHSHSIRTIRRRLRELRGQGNR